MRRAAALARITLMTPSTPPPSAPDPDRRRRSSEPPGPPPGSSTTPVPVRGSFPVFATRAPDVADTPLPIAPSSVRGAAPAAPTAGDLRYEIGLAKDLKTYIEELQRRLKSKTRQLREARKYVDNIVGSMLDALVVIDPDGIIVTTNPAASELFGWPEEELVGRPAASLFANPADGEVFDGEELARSETVRLEEVACRHHDGGTFPATFSARAMRDNEGRLIGFVGIARDIRELKRLEQEKILAIRTLAATVAHEIRNPLGAIRNSVGLLRRDLEVDGDDAELLDIVAEESERINAIVTEFLGFARPAETRFTDLDLGVLVRETVVLARQDQRVGEAVPLELDLPEVLPSLHGDPDKLRQVLWNLLINAIEALGAERAGRIGVRVVGRGGTDARRGGGGDLREESDDDGARPGRGRDRVGYILVEVSDTGCGMDDEALARAFEPFQTTKARGTGLGLAVVKSIIEEHGGTVRVTTRPGEGTTVSFTLPRRRS